MLPLTLVLAFGAPSALAAGDAEEAEIAFQLGARSYADRDYEGALAHFLASNRLAPNPAVAFNIGRCYASLERNALAYRWFGIAQEGLTSANVQRAVAAELAKITPKVVVYAIDSDPPGAEVYLDRKDLGVIGTTPFRVAMDPSGASHQFLFEKTGYGSATIDAKAGEPGSTVQVATDLQQLVGTLQVNAPAGTSVRLGTPDGPELCVAPCAVPLPPGTVVLHFRKDAFRDAVRQLDIELDRTTAIDVLLAPKTGSVFVNVSERGALVEIDGERAGFTPSVIQSVAIGERKVKITLPGYAPYETTIVVGDEQQAELSGIELVPLNEVTAVSRRAEPVERAPSSLTILSREELQAFHYPTIYEALRGVRGFALAFDGIYGSANVRGLGRPDDYNNRLLILQDGATLNDNLLVQGFIGYDGRTDLEGVNRIEVVRGPGSILYGTGAVSGVVNLVMDPPEARDETRVTVGTYDVTVGRAAASAHYQLSDSGGFQTTLSGALSRGYPVTLDLKGSRPDVEVPDFDKFQSYTSTGRIWFRDASVQWLHTHRAQATPSEAVLTEFANPDQLFVDDRTMVEIKLDTDVSKSLAVLSRAYLNRYRFDGESSFTGGSVQETNEVLSAGVEARVTATLQKFRLTAGGVVEYNPLLTMRAALVDPTTGEPDPASTFLDASTTYGVGAGYILGDFAPIDALRLTAGARFDYNSKVGGVTASPRVTLVAEPDEGDYLKVVAGRAFRAPSIYVLTYDDPFLVPPEPGALAPETVQSAEIEYTHKFDPHLSVLFAAYGAISQGTIVQGQALSSATSPYDSATTVNSDRSSRFLGGDVEISRSFERGFMASAFYSYLDPRDIIADGPDVLVPGIPLHQSGAKIVVPVAGPVARVGLRLTLEAARRLGVLHPSGLDPAFIGDLVVSGELPEYRFEYAVGLYNAFDQPYAHPVGDLFPSRRVPQEGRSFMAELSLGF